MQTVPPDRNLFPIYKLAASCPRRYTFESAYPSLKRSIHDNDAIMGAMGSEINSLVVVNSTVYKTSKVRVTG